MTSEEISRVIEGEWAAVPTCGEVLANEFALDPMTKAYTIAPASASKDAVVTFSRQKRELGRANARKLRQSASRATQRLAGTLRSALTASRMTMRVGGMEEGPELDEDAIPLLAGGVTSERVHADDFRRLDENTFVCVLVDCSGSMGTMSINRKCSECGEDVPDDKSSCDKRPYRTVESHRRCGGDPVLSLGSKSAYAAMTAAVLHDALRLCRIQHCVLGYTTRNSIRRVEGFSRSAYPLKMLRFVDAPGLMDGGEALTYINGMCQNLDGESVLWAAKHALETARDADRVVLFVISDGLPAGADDSSLEGPYLKRTVEMVARAGIEVYGLGIGIGYQKTVFQEYYPDQRSRAGRAATGNLLIPNGEGLSDTVLREMVALLAREAGFSRKGFGA